MDEACEDAGHEAGCMKLNKKYQPKDGPHPASECDVTDQSPDIDEKVSAGTRITLEIQCREQEETNETNETNGTDSNNEKPTTGQPDE